MFLGALEPRIQAAVAIEGNFANVAGPFYDPPGSISDAETDIVGSLPLRMDRGDLLTAFAPKPLLVCYTKNDEGETYGPLNTEAVIENFDELTRVYGILGASDKVGLFAGDLPHGMDFFSRRAIYGWFNRWFDKDGSRCGGGGIRCSARQRVKRHFDWPSFDLSTRSNCR